MPEVTRERAEAAKQTALQRFQTIGKVVGVGITRIGGEYAVKVNLSEPLEPGIDAPAEIDGVRVRVEVTGVIRAR
jgi:hypothetical protein